MEGLSIGLSILAIIIAGIALFLSKPLERKTFKSEAMLSLFKILSDVDVKNAKKVLVDEYLQRKTAKETATFENFQKETYTVMQAMNQACALYELDLIDKKHFRDVYGGNIVRTFNFSEDHIIWWEPNNKEYCKHFKNVSSELIKKYKIKGEVYRDISTTKTP